MTATIPAPAAAPPAPSVSSTAAGKPGTTPGTRPGTCAVVAPLADFRDALARVSVAVKDKSTLPVLACVLLTVEPAANFGQRARLTLTATDLDRILDVALAPDDPDAVQVTAPGRTQVAIPAKTLAAALANAAGDVLSLTVTGGSTATLRVGRSRYTLPVLDASEWPAPTTATGAAKAPAQTPDAGTVAHDAEAPTVTAGALVRMLTRVAHAASTEESRPILNGVLLTARDAGTCTAVATNTASLAEVTMPLGVALAAETILPTTARPAIARLFDAHELVTVASDGDWCVVASPTRRLAHRLIQGPYPNYRPLVREKSPIVVRFDRAALLAAVKRVAFLGDGADAPLEVSIYPPDAGQSAPVCLVFLARATTDQGIATESVSATWQTEPARTAVTAEAPFRVALGAGYLRDLLATTLTGEAVDVGCEAPERVLVLTDPADAACVGLIMPRRLAHFYTPSTPEA